MIKDKNKEVYTSPITDTLELHVESVILDGSLVYGNSGQSPAFPSGSIDDFGDF